MKGIRFESNEIRHFLFKMERNFALDNMFARNLVKIEEIQLEMEEFRMKMTEIQLDMKEILMKMKEIVIKMEQMSIKME